MVYNKEPIGHMETICISLGGSTFSGAEGVNAVYIKKFIDLLAGYKDKRFVVVVGGGAIARKYIGYAKEFTDNQSALDDIAIGITRINAMILKEAATGKIDTYPNIVTTTEESKLACQQHKLVVSGGLFPGITTDAVSVLHAEAAGSKKLINISNVAYIYETSDIKNSKPIKHLSYEKLIELACKYDSRGPGSNFVFDIVGSKLAMRSHIKIYFVDSNINELKKAIDGKPHNGSVVD